MIRHLPSATRKPRDVEPPSPDWTPIVVVDDPSPSSPASSDKAWRIRSAGLLKSLVEYRLTLRSAARRAGDPSLAHRLRRLARRGRAAAKALRRAEPDLEAGELAGELDPVTGDPLWLRGAGEIGALGACLRRNRKVRTAIARTLAANPPKRVRDFLERLADQANYEAGTLNACLRDIAVLPGSPANQRTDPAG